MKQITLSIAAACLLFSCNKKEDGGDTDNPQTATIVGKWKAIAMESDKEIELGAGKTKNYYLIYDSCSRDNLETYSSATNGTRTYDEGATKCDPSDPQTINVLPYTISNNFIDFGGGIGFQLVSVDKTTLKYSYPVDWKTDTDSFEINVTVTLERQ